MRCPSTGNPAYHVLWTQNTPSFCMLATLCLLSQYPVYGYIVWWNSSTFRSGFTSRKLFTLCLTTLSLDKTLYHRWSVKHWRNDIERGEKSARNRVERVTLHIVGWGDLVAGTVPWRLRTLRLSVPLHATCSYSLQPEHPLEAVRFWRRLLFKFCSSFGFLEGEVAKYSDISERHTPSVFRATQWNIWNSLSPADSRIGSQDQSRVTWYRTRRQKPQDHPQNILCYCFSQF